MEGLRGGEGGGDKYIYPCICITAYSCWAVCSLGPTVLEAEGSALIGKGSFSITFRGKSVRSNCGPPGPPARTSCAALPVPDSAALRARIWGDPCTGDPACPPRGPKRLLSLVGCPVPSCPLVPRFAQGKSCGLGPPRTSRPGAAPTGAGCKNGIKTQVNPRVWHRGGRSQAGTAASATPSLLAPQGDSQNWGFGPSCRTRGSPTHG